MSKEEILELAIKLLEKLQRRDGTYLDNNKSFLVDSGTFLFTEYELANYIAKILEKYHPIPFEYLRFYLKATNNQKKRILIDTKKLALIKSLFRSFHPTNNILAGGSLAKTYLSVSGNRKVVIKEAHGWPAQKLRNETLFLKKLEGIPEVKAHLPQVLDYRNEKDSALLTLEYFPYKTLSYKILFGEIPIDKVKEHTVRILDFVSKNLWVKENKIPPKDYVKNFFLERIKNNAEMMAQKSEFMADLLKQKTILINSKIYKNLMEIVKIIEENTDLIGLLTPNKLSIIWGDLHPNNILIAPNNFILIDPRGNNGDYLYDLGKMYHTFGPGRYDFIDNDLFEIKCSKDKYYKINRKFRTDHPSWEMHEKLGEFFINNLHNYILPEDESWELRWHFLNFCIFATMPFFLLKGDEVEARALMGYSNALYFGDIFLKYSKKYV